MNVLSSIVLTSLFTALIHNYALSQTTNEIVNRIDHIVISTDSASNSDTIVIAGEDYIGYTYDNGCELLGIYTKDSLTKVESFVGLSYALEYVARYYNRGQLVFIQEVENIFPYIDTLGALDHTRTEEAFVGQYYFKNEVLIHSILKGERRIGLPEDSTLESTINRLRDFEEFDLKVLDEYFAK